MGAEEVSLGGGGSERRPSFFFFFCLNFSLRRDKSLVEAVK